VRACTRRSVSSAALSDSAADWREASTFDCEEAAAALRSSSAVARSAAMEARSPTTRCWRASAPTSAVRVMPCCTSTMVVHVSL
jgi:hypothetical protein